MGSVLIDTSPLDLTLSLSSDRDPSDVLRTNLEVPSVAPSGTSEVPVFTLVPVKNPLVTSAKQEFELYPAEYFIHTSQLDAL